MPGTKTEILKLKLLRMFREPVISFDEICQVCSVRTPSPPQTHVANQWNIIVEQIVNLTHSMLTRMRSSLESIFFSILRAANAAI